MAENKTMEVIHNDLMKKYHVLCGKLGMSQDEKDALMSAYDVTSSKDLDTHDLLDVIAKLENDLNKREHSDERDKLRKRLMAAIGGWLKSEGKYSNASIIKGIACRASGKRDFNDIPREQLRNLVYLFNKKVRDAESVDDVTRSNIVIMEPRMAPCK